MNVRSTKQALEEEEANYTALNLNPPNREPRQEEENSGLHYLLKAYPLSRELEEESIFTVQQPPSISNNMEARDAS